MSEPSRDDRAKDAAAHLQRGLLELIEAARAVLDVVEEAVREPGALATMVSETVGGFVNAAGIHPASGHDGKTERPSGVEHIRIS